MDLPGLHDDRLHIAWLPTSRTNPARKSFNGSTFSSSDVLLLFGVAISSKPELSTYVHKTLKAYERPHRYRNVRIHSNDRSTTRKRRRPVQLARDTVRSMAVDTVVHEVTGPVLSSLRPRWT